MEFTLQDIQHNPPFFDHLRLNTVVEGTVTDFGVSEVSFITTNDVNAFIQSIKPERNTLLIFVNNLPYDIFPRFVYNRIFEETNVDRIIYACNDHELFRVYKGSDSNPGSHIINLTDGTDVYYYPCHPSPQTVMDKLRVARSLPR